MDKQYGKVSNFGVAATLFLSTGMIIHVMVMPIILDLAKRDAWISVLIGAPFFLLWLMLLFKFIHILNGKPFIVWVQEKWGNLGRVMVTIIAISFLLFNATHSLIDTVIWTMSTYLQHTPYNIVGFGLLFVCMFLAYSGIQSIIVTASILFPLVSFLGFFISILNDKHKDFTLLLPILEHGYSVPLYGALYAFTAFCDCWVLLLIAHDMKTKPSKLFKWGYGLFLILLFIGPITAGITEFGPTEAELQRYPAYDQWKILSLGRLLQHVDFLSIFQWLSGSLIRISLAIYLLTQLIPTKKTKSKRILFIVLYCIIGSIMILKWRSDSILNFLKDYYFPLGMFTLVIFTILITITQLLSPNKNKKSVQSTSKDRQEGEQNEDESKY